MQSLGQQGVLRSTISHESHCVLPHFLLVNVQQRYVIFSKESITIRFLLGPISGRPISRTYAICCLVAKHCTTTCKNGYRAMKTVLFTLCTKQICRRHEHKTRPTWGVRNTCNTSYGTRNRSPSEQKRRAPTAFACLSHGLFIQQKSHNDIVTQSKRILAATKGG